MTVYMPMLYHTNLASLVIKCYLWPIGYNFTAMKIQAMVFWVMMPYSHVHGILLPHHYIVSQPRQPWLVAILSSLTIHTWT